MNLKSMKVGQTQVVTAEYQMDVLEEVENPGKWGWEITDESGDVADSKYGYPSYKKAEQDGEKALKKIK